MAGNPYSAQQAAIKGAGFRRRPGNVGPRSSSGNAQSMNSLRTSSASGMPKMVTTQHGPRMAPKNVNPLDVLRNSVFDPQKKTTPYGSYSGNPLKPFRNK